MSLSTIQWCFLTKRNTHTHTHTPAWPSIQSEDTIYTRVYSVFVPAFKARTNLCITHSKWGHFFTHLWTCLARTKRGLCPYPPTPILWQREDSAHSHKARTEILTSLCQNVLTLNVKNWFWSSLWMPGRTHTHTHPTHPHTHTPPHTHTQKERSTKVRTSDFSRHLISHLVTLAAKIPIFRDFSWNMNPFSQTQKQTLV